MHVLDYRKGWLIWRDIEQSRLDGQLSDPYTYRRAAIAAAKLGELRDAARIFIKGAEAQDADINPHLRCTYLAEAALAFSLAGEKTLAANSMQVCLDALPPVSRQSDSLHWEAILRGLTAITAQIRGMPLAYGDATQSLSMELGIISGPSFRLRSTDGRQDMRKMVLDVEVKSALLELNGWDDAIYNEIAAKLTAEDQLLRMMTCLNAIQLQVSFGVDLHYFTIVDHLVDSMERLRANSPYPGLTKNWVTLKMGLYVVAIVARRISFFSFVGTLRDGVGKGCSDTEILKAFEAASSLTLQEAYVGLRDSEDYSGPRV